MRRAFVVVTTACIACSSESAETRPEAFGIGPCTDETLQTWQSCCPGKVKGGDGIEGRRCGDPALTCILPCGELGPPPTPNEKMQCVDGVWKRIGQNGTCNPPMYVDAGGGG